MSTGVRPKVEMPRELEEFCRKLDIWRYVPTVVELVEKCFSVIEDVSFSNNIDPETGHEWLNIHFRWRGDTEDFSERYAQYIREKDKAVPWPDTDKFHLAYHLVGS